jgi:hypothetical protein
VTNINVEPSGLHFLNLQNKIIAEGEFFVIIFEFGESFGMSLKGDCHDLVVTQIFEFLVIFGIS